MKKTKDIERKDIGNDGEIKGLLAQLDENSIEYAFSKYRFNLYNIYTLNNIAIGYVFKNFKIKILRST